MKLIAHIDMDAFFASIEQRVNPHLRGKPVIVGGRNNKERSIICAASYEAKAAGIKNAMPSWRALQICPQAIFVPADTPKYIYTSEGIYDILRAFTPHIEKFSIDEFFLDITDTVKFYGSPQALGASIKEKIKAQFGLTCSVGIGPTRTTSKLIAKLRKPDGLIVCTREEVIDIIRDLPVEKICGIGSRLGRRFDRLGIKTCGQLSEYPDDLLDYHFGVVGMWLKQACLAEEVEIIGGFRKGDGPPKSVGHSQTLRELTDDREYIKEWIYLLCEMVAQRLRRKKLQGRTVHFYVADGFYGGVGKQKTFGEATYDGQELYRRCLTIIDLIGVKSLVARVLGVSVSQVSPLDDYFLFEKDIRRGRLLQSIDQINHKFGEWTVCAASLKRAVY